MQGFRHENIRRMAMDVTRDEGVQAVVQKILADEGKVDIAVNNADGISIGKS